MKIEVTDELFLNLIEAQYKFNRNQDNKLEIKFADLSDGDLVELYNRFAKSERQGVWIEFRENGRLVLVGNNGERGDLTMQELRNYFNEEIGDRTIDLNN